MTWLSQIFGFLRVFQIWIVIAPWESGLRVRLGKSSTVLLSGSHWRIPFLDRIFVQPIRLRTISDSGQTVSTKDGKVLTVQVSVSYAISDIQKLYQTVCNPETTLLNQIQGAIASIASNTISENLTLKTVEDVAEKQIPGEEWGLSQVKILVTSFAYVRVYRLLNDHAYRSLSSSNELEPTNQR